MMNLVKKIIKKLSLKKENRCEPIENKCTFTTDENIIIKNKVQKYAPDFDAFFYKKANPDTALLDPYFHYWKYGRFENRYYKKTNLLDSIEKTKINNNKENIIIVVHELSRTGCPILSLNIANHLKFKYNLFALPLRKGTMVEEFNHIFDVVLESSSDLLNQHIIYNELDEFLKKSPFKFLYAITNSIVSRVALPPIAKNFIPSISLVHEFASNTKPRDAIRESLLWSDQTIFSAQIVLDDNIKHCNELNNFDISIIPQGKCESFLLNSPPPLHNKETIELIKFIKENDHTILILGCGFVDIRKGVDLFLSCAAATIQKDTKTSYKFIWAGGGFDPENDLSYSSYLQDQIIRSGIESEIKFIGEIENIDQVYELSDVLFLSSRLDPLPNVAIEAMSKGVPIVCFDKTSGISEILKQYECGKYCVAPYLDTQKASELIINLTNNKLVFNYVSKQMKEIAEKSFNMDLYVKKLNELAKKHIKEVQKNKKEHKILLEANCIDAEFMLPVNMNFIKEKDGSILFFIHSWKRGIYLCKPYPGFHPGIYAEKRGIDCKKENPLVNYIENNKPDGEWNYPIFQTKNNANSNVKLKIPAALHIHCCCPKLLKDITTRLEYQELSVDLYLSVYTDDALEETKKYLDGLRFNVMEIQKTLHKKSSLYSLLTCFGKTFLDQYDFFGHVYTNTEKGNSGNESHWYTFLFEHLLGGKTPAASLILDKMNRTPHLGLVFPEDPRVSGWSTDDRQLGLELAQKLGIRTELARHHNYPTGAMFWARPQALRPLLISNFSWEESPEEFPLSDKPLAQSIERLLPYIVKHNGFDCLQTYVP